MALLAKQDQRISDLESQLASIRLDLKSANILHDEPYVPPAVDELAARPSAPIIKKSKVEQMVEDKDPFA